MQDLDEITDVGVRHLMGKRIRCKNHLGSVSRDGQFLQIGHTKFYRRTYLYCSCGRYHFRWEPTPIENNLIDSETLENFTTIDYEMCIKN